MKKIIIITMQLCFLGAVFTSEANATSVAVKATNNNAKINSNILQNRNYTTPLQNSIDGGVLSNVLDLGVDDGNITPDDGKGKLGIYIANDMATINATDKELKDGYGRLTVLKPNDDNYSVKNNGVVDAGYRPKIKPNENTIANEYKINFYQDDFDISLIGGHDKEHVIFFKYSDPLLKKDVFFKMVNQPITVNEKLISQKIKDISEAPQLSVESIKNLQDWSPNALWWIVTAVTVILIAYDGWYVFSKRAALKWSAKFSAGQAAKMPWVAKIIYTYGSKGVVWNLLSFATKAHRFIRVGYLLGTAAAVYYGVASDGKIEEMLNSGAKPLSGPDDLLKTLGANPNGIVTYNSSRLEPVTLDDVQKYKYLNLQPSHMVHRISMNIFNEEYGFAPVGYTGSVLTFFGLSSISNMYTPAASKQNTKNYADVLKTETLVGDRTPDSSDYIVWKNVKTKHLMDAALMLSISSNTGAFVNDVTYRNYKEEFADKGFAQAVVLNDAPNISITHFASKNQQQQMLNFKHLRKSINGLSSGLEGFDALVLNSGDIVELTVSKPKTTRLASGMANYQNPMVSLIDMDENKVIDLSASKALKTIDNYRPIQAYFTNSHPQQNLQTLGSWETTKLTLDLTDYKDSEPKIMYLNVQDYTSSTNVIPVYINNVAAVKPNKSYSLTPGSDGVSNSFYNLMTKIELQNITLDTTKLPSGITSNMVCYRDESEKDIIKTNPINLPAGGKAHCKVTLTAAHEATPGDYELLWKAMVNSTGKENIVSVPVNVEFY